MTTTAAAPASLASPAPLTLWRPPLFDSHPAKRPKFPRRALCLAVIDGDTQDFLVELGIDSYRYTRVRVAVIDCPEIFHPKSSAELTLGLEAKQAAVSLLLNQPAMLDFGDESQVQGRMIARVAYWQNATWNDLGDYMTINKLLKSDVVVTPTA